MTAISRKEAQAQGLIKYHTGKPCRNLHDSERYVNTGACVECAKARVSRWQAVHKEQFEEIIRTYQSKNKAHLAEKGKEWKSANKAKIAHQNKLRYHANREKALAISKKWRAANPDKINALKSRRIAAKLQATPLWANNFYISQAYHLAKRRKEICGGEWHVDHIVPLRSDLVCGLHCEANLQVVPGTYNRKKSNKFWPDMP